MRPWTGSENAIVGFGPARNPAAAALALALALVACADVPTRPRKLMLVLALLTVAAYAACGDGATEPPAPDPPRATTLAVTPAAVQLIALGATVQWTAEVRDQNGNAMAGAAVSWVSSTAAVATVSASGLVTTVANGTATITATAGSASGTATVTVDQSANPDRAVLMTLYETTDGPNWVNNDNWLSEKPLGDWYGVSVDASGRVIGLDLAGRWDNDRREYVQHGLYGPIPAEVGTLASLRTLDLAHNSLTGPIPASLGELTQLVSLDLAASGRLGSIPPELGKLANLKDLNLCCNELTGPIPAELANLKALESFELNSNRLTGAVPAWLGELSGLQTIDLILNQLTGPIPPEIGGLRNLSYLALGWNQLSGPIPQGLLRLDRLRSFYVGATESLCIPGSSAFASWLRGIDNRDDDSATVLCNAADVVALKQLYETAEGTDWTESTGWTGAGAVEEWHGVSADSLGRVTALVLTRNGLAGRLPRDLGELTQMTELRIGENAELAGRLPLSLTGLSLQALHYSGTGVCAPVNTSFRDWLSAIPAHEGTGTECPPLSERDVLEELYLATGGPEWDNSENWLTDAPLWQWHGVSVDAEDRVSRLSLAGNNLKGPVPAELGNLSKLELLDLSGNNLSGSIPVALGDLVGLNTLIIAYNDLSGSIPPSLGRLSKLRFLSLVFNRLTGPLPPELSRLSSLEVLDATRNRLTGEIPAELGTHVPV